MTITSVPDTTAQPSPRPGFQSDLSKGKPRSPNRTLKKLGPVPNGLTNTFTNGLPDTTLSNIPNSILNNIPNNILKGEIENPFHLVSDESILIRPHP